MFFYANSTAIPKSSHRRIKNPITRLRQSTCECNAIHIQHIHQTHQPHAEEKSRLLKHKHRKIITRLCRFKNNLRGQPLGFQRRLRFFPFKSFQRAAHHSRGRCIHLQTSKIATRTTRPIVIHCNMPHLGRIAIKPVHNPSLANPSTANPCPQSHAQKVINTSTGPQPLLAISRQICIIIYHHAQTEQRLQTIL